MPLPGTLHLRLQARTRAQARDEAAPPDHSAEITTFSLHWDIAPAPVDEGLPPALVQLLAQTLCAVGKLSFVSDALGLDDLSLPQRARALLPGAALHWQDRGGYRVAPVSLPAIRLTPLAIVETRQADIARHLFGIQAWHYAPCQMACLTPPHSPPLQLPARVLSTLITAQAWRALLAPLRSAQVHGLFLPGHDGAWLDCVFLQAATARQFVAELRRQAGALGWPLHDTTRLFPE